ncbi:hypothetical protein GC105_01250 [Alkalibaculum sp. M08DMB]|uniref:Uncharacterized protein n=1 Tax=Alkalibaculum sporogenes TaxID=2655001 RepID=A0A6A7K4V4_9FIRM|nr:hypothetical protein [Alkalibaculum sporogenes]MPW24418.1 hypothetical protein [Alkalibaculum sporogenes]
MIYKGYFIYGFWHNSKKNTFYFNGVNTKNILLIIVGILFLLLGFIAQNLEQDILVNIFSILSMLTIPASIYFSTKFKYWFSYNQRNKETTLIYKGNKIPQDIYDALSISKKKFIAKTGFNGRNS